MNKAGSILFSAGIIFAGTWFMNEESSAAIQSERNPDFVAPTESMSVLRGEVSICRSPTPQGGKGGLSFLQTGSGACPIEPRTAKGYDRPEHENDSPGIPFKNEGLQ